MLRLASLQPAEAAMRPLWRPHAPFLAQLLGQRAKEKAPARGAYRMVSMKRPAGRLNRLI